MACIAEVISTDLKSNDQEGESLAELPGQFSLKFYLIKDGIQAINILRIRELETNCTLVFLWDSFVGC